MKNFMIKSAGFAAALLISATPALADHCTGCISSDDIAEGAVRSAGILNNSIKAWDIADGAVGSGELNDNIHVESVIDRSTAQTGSFQNVAADLTYAGAAGGTSTYHAGVMGNFLGTALTNTTSSYHAGVIGSYNVETSDASTGAEAGVVGEVGTDIGTAAAVMAVLGGDSGSLTPAAAYGVQYFNSTAASKFDYGLDLFHAATADYTAVSAVDFGTADIRLAAGTTISSGSASPATCVTGSLFLDTDGGADATLRACTATNTWTAVSNE